MILPVGHTEVHRVGPKWWIGQGCSDRGIVQEGLLFHHGELVVTTHAKVWGSKSHHAVISQIRVFFSDYAHTGHFLGPVFDGGVAPELFVIVVPADKRKKFR